MTDKTTKKTVGKASAGKQVKAAGSGGAAMVAAPSAQQSPSTGKSASPAKADTQQQPKAETKPAQGKEAKASATPPMPPVEAESAAPAKPAKPAMGAVPAPEAAPTAQPVRAEPLPVSPSWEDVARKAYELYEQDGHGHGRDQDHWYRAEQALRQRSGH